MSLRLPGYAALTAGKAHGVALESCKSFLESILATESLYDHVARQPLARRFSGRAPVFAIELPEGCGAVVVRRSMRGGVLARLNTDLFLPPTRVLRELIISVHLRSLGVATPEVVAVAVYHAGRIFRRSDVVTREVVDGTDLGAILTAGQNVEQRSAALDATARLVASLSRAGAHHPDLNVRNILIKAAGQSAPDAPGAFVLDVDRIRMHVPGDPIVLSANIQRLERSMRKLRDAHSLVIEDSELDALRTRTRELAS